MEKIQLNRNLLRTLDYSERHRDESAGGPVCEDFIVPYDEQT